MFGERKRAASPLLTCLGLNEHVITDGIRVDARG